MPPSKKSAPNTKAPARPLPTTLSSHADRLATAWLESYNPLRGLSLRTAQGIFDAARRGNDVRLQWLYENIEQSDPTLMICAERRASALIDLSWLIRPKASSRTRGFDEALAREQVAFLEQAYGSAEEANLVPTIEHLAKAFFRGHAHARALFSSDGLTLRGFDLLNSWNVCRDVVSGQWFWNPSASESLDFSSLAPVPPGELCTLVRTRHIDYPALAIYLRNNLGEKAWGKFLERYGIPPVIITMPPDVDPAQVEVYCDRAARVADGGSGALPAGSTVSYATEARGTNPFAEFLDHQQKLIVLMATGGMLTSLTGSTGIGQGATSAHEETWRTIVRRDAAAVATVLNRSVSNALLSRAFPGKPHLAAFDFETEPPPSASEVFALAAQAVQAGYQIAKEDLEERTGFSLQSVQAPQPLDPSDSSAQPSWSLLGNSSTSSIETQSPVINKAPDSLKRLRRLASALQDELSPAAEALQAFLKAPTQAEAQALASRLPDLLEADPETAAILEAELARAFQDALGESTPIANSQGECHAQDPASCPTHGSNMPPQAASTQASLSAESLPPKPDRNAPASEYRKANRARGEAALHAILETHADVPSAMVSRKLGPIDFVWGKVYGDHEGFGFAHIIDKHGLQAAQKVPAILAHGKYFHDEFEQGAYTVVLGNEIVLVKREQGNYRVVSSYTSDKKTTAYLRRGGQIENKAKGDSATF